MIEKLRKINDELIEKNKDNQELLKKQNLIHEMLDFDDLFFRINVEDAYGILRDLGFEENQLKEVYLKLIDKKNY
ncbi:MAG: hypothetical protein IKQ35_00785 [Bacilli bacterium]|nr:hypothetical protein [Bacilli bacterium]